MSKHYNDKVSNIIILYLVFDFQYKLSSTRYLSVFQNYYFYTPFRIRTHIIKSFKKING